MSVVAIMVLADGLCFPTVAWGHFCNQLPATVTSGLFTSFHFPDLTESQGILTTYNVETSRVSSLSDNVRVLRKGFLFLMEVEIFLCATLVLIGPGNYSASSLIDNSSDKISQRIIVTTDLHPKRKSAAVKLTNAFHFVKLYLPSLKQDSTRFPRVLLAKTHRGKGKSASNFHLLAPPPQKKF
jgi:hypothetical protein